MAATFQPKKIKSPKTKKRGPGGIKKNTKAIKKSSMVIEEWWLILGVLFFIDIIEIILGFFVIGEVVNTFIDVVVGACLSFYLWLRGENVGSKGITSLVVSFLLELIPFVNDLPLWSFDGLYLMSQSRLQNREAKKEEAKVAQETQNVSAIERRENIIDFQQELQNRRLLEEQQQADEDASIAA